MRIGLPEHKEEYKMLDREVKKGARRSKAASYARFMEELAKASNSERLEMASGFFKAKERVLRKNVLSSRRIEARNFTDHIADEYETNGELDETPSTFTVDNDWEKDFLEAVKQAPKAKAVGSDEVFAECLQANPEVTAKTMMALWKGVGGAGFLPSERYEAKLSPIFQKRDASDSKNHRPIALLSHRRKVVEKLVDWRLRAQYKF